MQGSESLPTSSSTSIELRSRGFFPLKRSTTQLFTILDVKPKDPIHLIFPISYLSNCSLTIPVMNDVKFPRCLKSKGTFQGELIQYFTDFWGQKGPIYNLAYIMQAVNPPHNTQVLCNPYTHSSSIDYIVSRPKVSLWRKQGGRVASDIESFSFS